MFFVIFGFRDSKLKNKPLKGNTVCTKCSSTSSFDVKGTAGYFYLFWIPIIPLGKTIEFTCRKCGQHHFKETAPKSLLSRYKEEPLKRPWWHYLFLVILTYQLISFAGFWIYSEVDSMIDESKRNTKREQEREEQQFNVSQLKTDFNKVTTTPVFKKDSISYLLNREIDFALYGLNKNNVKLYSSVKNNMLLTLLNSKGFDATEEANKMLLLKHIRDVINKTYYKKAFAISIGVESGERLFISTSNSSLVEYDDVENSDYYNYPLKHYYTKDSISSYDLITQLEHDRFLYKLENKTTKRVELDTTKLIDIWERINEKYKFKYKRKIKPLPNRVFLNSSETLLPEDLRFFFKHQNLNGPFIPFGKLEVRLEEMNRQFYRTPVVSLKNKKYADKSKRIATLMVSPRWLTFYEDYTYSYAVDIMPDENGHIGQIIQLGKNGEPSRFITTDLVTFLELYLKGKVPTDIQDWN